MNQKQNGETPKKVKIFAGPP